MIARLGLLTRIAVAVALMVSVAGLVSAPNSLYTTSDKAYYADPNLINFVRPGLTVTILSASIAADGTIQTRFRLTDSRGLGLDRLGVTTPGPVSISFIAAYIPKGQTQYVSYTTRVQTSPINGRSATQAAGENNGTFAVAGDGEYTYTFRTRAPATIDRTATHTIGAYSSRNLSEFGLPNNFDDAVFHFVPDGSAVTTVRDVVKTATCNNCHDQMAFHGGSRRTMELCVMCHTPQTVDPDTGNTVDMPVMTHKIHMGHNLPSVAAGGQYVIIGNQQSVHDYSHVRFPAGVNNCQACHKEDATQKDAWFNASRAACGACHDNVNFATGEGHVDLPQVSDNQCKNCHTPQGELEYDASIIGAHTTARLSPSLPGTVFELKQVADGTAGSKPTVVFSIKDKSGRTILPSEMTRLALVLAGPTSDYKTYVSQDARQAQGSGGEFYWTFGTAIPADARGTYTVGIEGYRNRTLLAGTAKQRTVRDAGQNQVIHFPVDGSPVEPRRQVVSLAKCNNCHSSLSLHGDNRNTIEMCVLCHNPVETDAARRPANQMPAQSVDFRTMIHRIHTGHELGFDYSIYGFGGRAINFNEVGYPGDRRNCSTCHVNNSEQLPLGAARSLVNDPRGPLSPMGPVTAACTSCHTSISAASHALVNTSALGESCATCHGPNAGFSINKVHAR
jgi:OmcA/MtrC family decaheme c-type cytochrome